MKKINKIIPCLWFLILALPVMSQVRFSFGVAGGLATYQMNDLKEVNAQQANSLNFETNEVSNFSPGLYLNIWLASRIKEKFQLSVIYRYQSTGSRIGQRDYSGFYTFDQIISAHFLGIEPETMISSHKFLEISLSMLVGFSFTNYEMKQILSVNGIEMFERQPLVAVSIPFNPSVNFYIPVINEISAKLSAGFLMDSGGKLHLKGDKDAVFMLQNEPVKTGWPGLRIAIGFCYNIP